MKKLKSLDEAALFVTEINTGDLKIGVPLGLGKANQLINLIYEKFKKTSQRKLEIYSALSLDLPLLKTPLEKKLLTPFLQRHFGADYPRLQYVIDLHSKKVPDHIKIHEFYFLAGQFLQNAQAQENYISLNYTHAARGISERGLQVLIQIVAKKGNSYSLSCNPDMTLDLADIYREQNKKLYVIAVVHPDLPFLGGDAVVDESFFDAVVESDEVQHQLFALPRAPVDPTDHMIGFHASQLVPDEGTLQIGIGSLSDSLVHWMIQRHQHNEDYRKIAGPSTYHLEPFTKGLYGTSEMIMDGFMHLRQAGILKRMIFDQDEKKQRYLHGAFFLGSKKFYEWLRQLNNEDYEGLSMTRVSKVNDLYDEHEMALRRQRKNARFFNTCMQVDLLGAAMSDTLGNGQVVSGVGGQHNFVAMSQELVDSKSVLMLRSTRQQKGRRRSNIVTQNGQITIPRHLRDVIITEYGIAELRGKSDTEVIQALIQISDSQFQSELIQWAQKNNKLSKNYHLPEEFKNNTPEKIKAFIDSNSDFFPEAPFGLDFTPTEFKLIKALTHFKEKPKLNAIASLISNLFVSSERYRQEIEHFGHLSFMERRIVLSALADGDRR